MPKFTPGPWEVFLPGRKFVQSCRNFKSICELIQHDRTEEIVDANARLIASAPELYRELAHLVRLLGPCEDQLAVPGLATLNGARAALAKADGK